jgi:hypothetical protein
MQAREPREGRDTAETPGTGRRGQSARDTLHRWLDASAVDEGFRASTRRWLVVAAAVGVVCMLTMAWALRHGTMRASPHAPAAPIARTVR